MLNTVGIGYEVKALSNEFKRILDKEAQKSHVTGMQQGVINFIGIMNKEKSVFQKDIELEFNIRRSTATGILQLMEQKDLIIRTSNSKDARLKEILLTVKGKALFQTSIAKIWHLEQQVQSNVSSEELEIFHRVMNKISKNLKKIS